MYGKKRLNKCKSKIEEETNNQTRKQIRVLELTRLAIFERDFREKTGARPSKGRVQPPKTGQRMIKYLSPASRKRALQPNRHGCWRRRGARVLGLWTQRPFRVILVVRVLNPSVRVLLD